jgi:hypothetical protein
LEAEEEQQTRLEQDKQQGKDPVWQAFIFGSTIAFALQPQAMVSHLVLQDLGPKSHLFESLEPCVVLY